MSVLGLALDGGQLEAVVARRNGAEFQILKSVKVALALNPLNAEPELLGREIRNHLDQAGIKERRCVLAVPVNWALTMQTLLPDLPPGDLQSFLDIEAERSFSSGPESLIISKSVSKTGEEKNYATLAAISKNQLLRFDQALRFAKLQPVSFSFGISALARPDLETKPTIAIGLNQANIDLQMSQGGGVVALRSLEVAEEVEGLHKPLEAGIIAREIRITIGNLPGEFKSLKPRVVMLKVGPVPSTFSDDLRVKLEGMGMPVSLVETYADFGVNKASGSLSGLKISPALSLAANYLSGVRSVWEFLPPRVSAWQGLAARASSKKMAYAIGAAAAILFLVGGAFAIQQWQLSGLRSKWAGMESRVKELDDTQAQIRRFRAWFDTSFNTLSIFRKVTEAFPDDGGISAKSLQINDVSSVSCSGVAQNNQALFKVVDNLRASKEVENLKIDQMRGKAPLQFNFNFQWKPLGANEH